MLFLVRDILPAIAEKLGGAGLDLCNQQSIERCLKMYNRINEILMSRQDWPGTEDDIGLNVFGDVFTLPARFENIKALRVDDRALPIVPSGFRYLETRASHMLPMAGNSNVEHLGSAFATFRDLPAALPIFAVSDANETISVMVQGVDANGRDRRESVPVRCAYPDRAPKRTRTAFASISAITKPVTTGYIEIVAWDDTRGEALWLSSLAPEETTPGLTRYRLTSQTDGCERHVKARVSAAYREIWNPLEVAIIQAREPYRLMTQAIAHFDRSESGPGAEYQNRAVKLLKERAAKLAQGQEIVIPQHRANVLPARHGYSIRNYQ